MKSNVDLTENRTFTTQQTPNFHVEGAVLGNDEEALVIDYIMNLLARPIPWDFKHSFKKVSSDLDLVDENKSLIATGDKNARKNWHQNRAYDSGQVCWMCGSDVGKKPWAKKRCKCLNFTFFRKVPWRED